MIFTDSYDHLDQQIIYIIENIPCKETADLFDEEFSEGCSCELSCNPDLCSCLKTNQTNYVRTAEEDNTNDLCDRLSLNNWNGPVYECNDHCKCSQDCGNRLVQFGPRKNLAIVPSGHKGLGLLTNEVIRPGSFICEYAGELLSEDEAQNRYKKNDESGAMNYVFCLKENYEDKCVKYYVDPAVFGNIGRYVNHSCEPNSRIVPVKVTNDVPKLCIFSTGRIAKKAEITFDYGEGDESATALSKKPCLCMSQNCRKFMPFHSSN